MSYFILFYFNSRLFKVEQGLLPSHSVRFRRFWEFYKLFDCVLEKEGV